MTTHATTLPGGDPYPDTGTLWPPPRVGDDSYLGELAIRRAIIRRLHDYPQITVRTTSRSEALDVALSPHLWPGSGVLLSVSAWGRYVSFAVDVDAIRHGDYEAVGKAAAVLDNLEGYAGKLSRLGMGGWRVSRRPRWRFRGELRRGVSD